jgi:hypothetical protein
MSLQPTDYAALAQDSYNKPELDKSIPLGGKDYTPIAYKDDPHTGFQATAYQHVNLDGSRDVVIAYRGTEFGREPVHDGLTDAGMALAGVNAQTADSIAFTKQVMEKAKADADKNHSAVNFTVTGHSLGGTLAEINAYKFGLHGETFNAYGAAGLIQGIPEGGTQVIDNVRATDVVSAASPHFGQVRVYATQQDVDAIHKAGYSNSAVLNDLPTHAPILGKIQGEAHAVANFAPTATSPSIMNPEDAQRYQANEVMINAYRTDIRNSRAVAAIPGEAVATQVGITVGAGIYAAAKAEQAAKVVGQAAEQGIHAAERTAQAAGAAAVSAGQYVGHEAQQGYDYTKEKAVQGVNAAEHTAQTAGAAAVSAGQYVGHEAGRAYDATKQAVVRGAQGAERTVSDAAQSVSRATGAAAAVAGRDAGQVWDKLTHPEALMMDKPPTSAPRLNDPAHPGHEMYARIHSQISKIDSDLGRKPDQHTANLAGALTVAAKEQGLTRADRVVPSNDGSHFIVSQTIVPRAVSQHALVETAQAIKTPLEQSSAQYMQAQVQTNALAQGQAQRQDQMQSPQQHPQGQQPAQGPQITR